MPRLEEITFLAPHFLWIAVLGGILTLVVGLRRNESLGVTALRLVTLALISLAAAQPTTRQIHSQNELPVLVDVSASIAKEAKRELLLSLAPYLEGSTSLRLVPFAHQNGAAPISIDSLRELKSFAEDPESLNGKLDTGDTNIGSAITATSLMYQSSPLLLLSDGRETSGNARQAATLAASRGVGVFPLVVDEGLFHERGISISTLDAPLSIHAGEGSEVRVSLRNNDSDKARTGTLEIFLEKKKLASQLLTVPAKSEKVLIVATGPIEGGLHRLRAVFHPSEVPEGTAPKELHRWISAKSRSKLLLVSGADDDRRLLRQLLNYKGFTVEDLVADGHATIPTDFTDYSTVIFNNVAKRQLPDGFLSALRTHVEAGNGLVLIGGDRSFGLGNYIDTPLEEISPLKFVPPKTRQRRINSAVALVVDKSRSMAADEKLEGAKRAAMVAINSLKDDDFVGVIGFDSAPFVVIRVSPLAEVRPVAERRLRGLTAAGGTDLFPALAAARQALANTEAGRKHIIVLSDGIIKDAGGNYRSEIARLRQEGITVSAVALGAEADVPFMQMLSEGGRGAFYQTLDPSRIPEIFLHDIRVTTGERTMKEREDYPVSTGPGGILSTQLRTFPALRGFVETNPKSGAAVELVTESEGETFPILASWTKGGGKVIAFTSDANGRWSLPWVDWGGFTKFWSEVLESVERGPQTKSSEVDFDLRTQVARGALNLDLAIFDDKLASGASANVSARVISPSGETSTLAFQSERKGRFTGVVDHARPGDYRLEVTYNSVKLPPLAVTLSPAAFGEAPGQGLDIETLSDIARFSGGSLNPSPKELRSYSRESEERTHHFIPLVVSAFAILILGVFFREIGIRRFFTSLRRPKVTKQGGIYRPGRRLPT